MPIIIRKVISSKKAIEAIQNGHKPLRNNANQIRIYCPTHILKAFQQLLENSPLLGTSFINPYTNETGVFPQKASDLTAWHLQLLARNESSNLTGIMDMSLYDGVLTDDQVARLRCLVKSITVAGLANVYAYGGYHSANVPLTASEKAIIIDQSGLQWQGDFRNTGGMFFYPNNPNDQSLPPGYKVWQADMYQSTYGQARSAISSKNQLNVEWKKNLFDVDKKGVLGVIDLDQVQNAIAVEFLQALDSAAFQGNEELGANEKINFKFLKAGMGYFAAGIAQEGTENSDILSHTRLKGIEQALQSLVNLPADKRHFGKIKRLELPFSYQGNAQGTILHIEQLTKQLGLEWGGMPNDDALMPRAGFVNATTTCGDPHAMIGNEGAHASVDASIATNAQVLNLNMAYNPVGGCILKPERILEKQVELYGIKSNRNFFILGTLLTVIAGIAGVLALGPIGLIAAAAIALGFGSLALYQGRFNKTKMQAGTTHEIETQTLAQPSVDKTVSNQRSSLKPALPSDSLARENPLVSNPPISKKVIFLPKR